MAPAISAPVSGHNVQPPVATGVPAAVWDDARLTDADWLAVMTNGGQTVRDSVLVGQYQHLGYFLGCTLGDPRDFEGAQTALPSKSAVSPA